MKLGSPTLSRKPHFGVYDLFAKIDESEGFCELDIFDPSPAKDYVLMPKRMKGIGERTCRIEKLQERQILAMESFTKAMEEHRALIAEIRELV